MGAVTALAILIGGCGGDDEVRTADRAGDVAESTAPPDAECVDSAVDGPVVETLADFVDKAEVVALVELGETSAIESVRLPDLESDRLVAAATVVETVKGADVGDVLDLFYAVRSVDPTQRQRGESLQGPELHDFAAGDRLVVALTAESEAGEREMLAPHSFFVDLDGDLDPALAEARLRCTVHRRPLFTETEGMTTEDLLAAARAEAEDAG